MTRPSRLSLRQPHSRSPTALPREHVAIIGRQFKHMCWHKALELDAASRLGRTQWDWREAEVARRLHRTWDFTLETQAAWTGHVRFPCDLLVT